MTVPPDDPCGVAVLEAAAQAGLPTVRFNEGQTVTNGAGWFQVNRSPDGTRMSSSVAYLHPIMATRSNLKVRTGCWVKRIVIDEDRRARGVEYMNPDLFTYSTVGARREVILSCGSIDTPKALMMSGIGPGDHLREFGIDVLVDSPGVGSNLDDHVEGIVMWEAAQPMVKRSTQWWEIGLFTMTEDGLDRPDLMMHYGSVPFDMNTVRWGYPSAESAFCLTPNVCRGRSRGTVRLRSPDFRDRMRVDPRYFTDPDGNDERVMLHGVKLAREIGKQAALQGWAKRELAPGPDATTDDELVDYIHKTHNTVYHPSCTARMGAPGDADAVVDPRLRVKGVKALRIADGSIMPFLPAINPCITTMMIGEKCADLVKEDARQAPRRRCTRDHPLDARDGEWVQAASGETAETTSPATGETIGAIPQGDRSDAQRAIDAANRAFEPWSRLTAFERAAKMHAVGDEIERRRDDARPHADARPGQAAARRGLRRGRRAGRVLARGGRGRQAPRRRAAELVHARQARDAHAPRARRRRDHHALELAVHDACRAAGAGAGCGNTVVWTPAPTTAVCAVALAECMAEADLPPGVVNLVTGPGAEVGDEIARNPGTRAVAFIGSTPTGRSVAAAAAGKAVIIEMGGNGPVVVMDDADVDRAVDAVVAACFLCAGQSCTAGERILVHEAVRDEFVEKLARKVTETVLLGDPFDDATTMGPVNNAGVAVKMDEHVADAVDRGAGVVAGGSRVDGFPTDLYWSATVLDGVPSDARVATEETFGPIAPVVAIRSLDEAIEQTNASPYGLLSAIFTRDLAGGLRFADSVRTGWVNINESSNYWEAHLPFGGRAGTDSGIGRVGGSHVMDTFTELQTVTLSA